MKIGKSPIGLDGPDPIMSLEEIRHINDPSAVVKALGYDPEKYIWIRITEFDKKFIKMITHFIEIRKNGSDIDLSRHFSDSDRLNAMHEEYDGCEFIVELIYDNVVSIFGNKQATVLYVFTKKTSDAAVAIKKYIDHVSNKTSDKTKTRITLAGDGFPKQILGRSMDTIYLSKKIKKDIIDDITKFLSEESVQFYYKHGIPHKLSYLLYGLPGTGKTSLVKALATHFSFPIHILRINMHDDNSLAMVKSGITNRCILLIEDLDSAFTNMNDAGTRNIDPRMGPRASFSSLLELLDGIESPEELLIFITCNNTDILNSPYIRDGRIDKTVHFGPLTTETATDMINGFFPDNKQPQTVSAIAAAANGTVTPVTLQTIIMSDMNLSSLAKNISSKIATSKNKFVQVHQQNNTSYTNYYGNAYRGFQQTGMYS